MKTLPKLLSLVLLLGLPVVMQAQDFTYTTNGDNTITITGYIGAGGDVIIPDTITGFPVTRLENAAFTGLVNLTNVTIPNSITSVGNAAFSGCSVLSRVFFQGNAPATEGQLFDGSHPILYHLSDASGWTNHWEGRPAVAIFP